MTPTNAEMIAAIREVQSRGFVRGDIEPAEAPEPDWRSDWDGDRAAETWENSVVRSWP